MDHIEQAIASDLIAELIVYYAEQRAFAEKRMKILHEMRYKVTDEQFDELLKEWTDCGLKIQ